MFLSKSLTMFFLHPKRGNGGRCSNGRAGAERWGFSEVVQHGVEVGVRDEYACHTKSWSTAASTARIVAAGLSSRCHASQCGEDDDLDDETTQPHEREAPASVDTWLLLPTPMAPREGETVATRRCAKGTERGSHRGRGCHSGRAARALSALWTASRREPGAPAEVGSERLQGISSAVDVSSPLSLRAK